MGQYKYVARTLNNKKVKGVMVADTVRDLQSELKLKQLTLVKSKEISEKTVNTFFTLSSKIKKSDIVTFIRQLAVMVSAGIGVDEAIDTLRGQVTSKTFQKILTKVYDDLLKGTFLSDAFSKYPKIFPSFFKNMIYVGEISGNLDFVLNGVADYYERDMKIKAKTKGAMAYPMFLLGLIVVVFVFLTVFIVPEFDTMLSQLGGELPAITKFILAISEFMQKNYLKLIGGVLGTFAFIFLFFRTKKGKMVRDYLKVSIPLIKKISRAQITARFSRGLGVLIKSGMLVIDSIEATAKLMDNVYFQKRFQYAVDEVRRGKRIARSIDNINFFPPMLVEMVLVGEQTGSLEQVLEKTADFYDDELEKTISQVTSALEPMLIILAAGVVVVVILAIFLPMLSIVGRVQ